MGNVEDGNRKNDEVASIKVSECQQNNTMSNSSVDRSSEID